MPVDHTGGRGKRAAKPEGQAAHRRPVDAQARRREPVVPTGGQGPAEPAVPHGQKQQRPQDQQPEQQEKRRPVAGELAKPWQPEPPVHHESGRPARKALQSQDQVHENQRDAQRGHGQEALAQAFHGPADKPGRETDSHHHARYDVQRPVGKDRVQQHRTVGAKAGKGRLGQGNLAAEAEAEIEGQHVDGQKKVLVHGHQAVGGHEQAHGGQHGQQTERGKRRRGTRQVWQSGWRHGGHGRSASPSRGAATSRMISSK